MGNQYSPLRAVIARHGLVARRSLGQHFLLDGNLAAKIAGAAGCLDGRHVIEVGPGPGGLTRALLQTNAASVISVEIDDRFVNAIREMAQDAAGRLTVVAGDALKLDMTRLAPAPRQIVANLPYNIATPLLIGWLRNAAEFERLTLMFQHEVAERICALPGSRAYGRLSVLAQWTCAVSLQFRIPPTAFVPPPKVWSAVVRFIPRDEQPDAALFAAMERVTAAGFGARRKMLHSALRSVGGDALLTAAKIRPDRRAETLTVGEFDLLARICSSAAMQQEGAPQEPQLLCQDTPIDPGRAPA